MDKTLELTQVIVGSDVCSKDGLHSLAEQFARTGGKHNSGAHLMASRSMFWAHDRIRELEEKLRTIHLTSDPVRHNFL